MLPSFTLHCIRIGEILFKSLEFNLTVFAFGQGQSVLCVELPERKRNSRKGKLCEEIVSGREETFNRFD